MENFNSHEEEKPDFENEPYKNPDDFKNNFGYQVRSNNWEIGNHNEYINTVILPKIEELKMYVALPEQKERFITMRETSLLETIHNIKNILDDMFEVDEQDVGETMLTMSTASTEHEPGSQEWHVALLKEQQEELYQLQQDVRTNKEIAKTELYMLEKRLDETRNERSFVSQLDNLPKTHLGDN